MSTLEFVLPEGSPDPCPNACGRLTEDPYGGPCKACWNAVCRDDDEEDEPRCTLVEGLTTCYCTSRPGCQRPHDEDEDDGWCEGDDGVCDDPYCCASADREITTVDTGGLT